MPERALGEAREGAPEFKMKEVSSTVTPAMQGTAFDAGINRQNEPH